MAGPKPCSTCGSEDVTVGVYETPGGDSYSVECSTCGKENDGHPLFPTAAEAVENWNRRPIEDELREKLRVARLDHRARLAVDEWNRAKPGRYISLVRDRIEARNQVGKVYAVAGSYHELAEKLGILPPPSGEPWTDRLGEVP